jgi:Mor family transcriptional regulator
MTKSPTGGGRGTTRVNGELRLRGRSVAGENDKSDGKFAVKPKDEPNKAMPYSMTYTVRKHESADAKQKRQELEQRIKNDNKRAFCILENPNSTPDSIRELMDGGVWDIETPDFSYRSHAPFCIAKHPNTPQDVLRKTAHGYSSATRAETMKHAKDEDILLQGAGDHWSVQYEVVKNKNSTNKVLEKCYESHDPTIRRGSILHPNASDTLVEWGKEDADESVRKAAETVAKERSKEREAHRQELWDKINDGNEQEQLDVLKDSDMQNDPTFANVAKTHLAKYSKHPLVMLEIAGGKDTPADALRITATNSSPNVRHLTACNLNTNSDILDISAHDTVDTVVLGALKNPNLHGFALSEVAMAHPNEYVRKKAKQIQAKRSKYEQGIRDCFPNADKAKTFKRDYAIKNGYEGRKMILGEERRDTAQKIHNIKYDIQLFKEGYEQQKKIGDMDNVELAKWHIDSDTSKLHALKEHEAKLWSSNIMDESNPFWKELYE